MDVHTRTGCTGIVDTADRARENVKDQGVGEPPVLSVTDDTSGLERQASAAALAHDMHPARGTDKTGSAGPM